jgi:hypothetical protein
MIGRQRHGWTKCENAHGFEQLVRTEILPGFHDATVIRELTCCAGTVRTRPSLWR